MRRRSSNPGVVVAAISEEAAVEKKAAPAPAPAKTKARAALTVRRKSKEDFKDTIVGHLDALADMIGRKVVLELISTDVDATEVSSLSNPPHRLISWLHGQSIMENGEIESTDEEMPLRGGRQYRPVGSHDRAIIQMSSMERGSVQEIPLNNSHVDLFVPLYFMRCFYYQPNKNNLFKFISYRNLKVGPQANIDPRMQEGSSESHEAPNGSHKESKLELFDFDSLVNILGLKSMTGEQIPAPSSPRDGEDVTITIGHPK
ncbi:Cation-chloride cotransporter 1, partial [Ananas comosus]